jgi:hypothetical protein
MSVNEFFEIVDSTGRVGNWSETDKIQITTIKLTDTAKAFYSGSLELHAPDITWENFKALSETFQGCPKRPVSLRPIANCETKKRRNTAGIRRPLSFIGAKDCNESRRPRITTVSL